MASKKGKTYKAIRDAASTQIDAKSDASKTIEGAEVDNIDTPTLPLVNTGDGVSFVEDKSTDDRPRDLTSAETTVARVATRVIRSKSFEHNESGSSESADDTDPAQVMQPRTAKRDRLQKDLLLWGLPAYAFNSKLPGKATILFDGDKSKWTSFCHDLAVCLQARGQQFLSLLNNDPDTITGEVL